MDNIKIENIENVIAIRFSIRANEDWIRRAYGAEENREKWFQNRARLFNEITYQSLIHQSVSPKTVLVVMDENDKLYYERYFKKSPMITPVFCPAKDAKDVMKDAILKSSPKNVMISRLDSDDAISTNYLEEINKTIVRNQQRIDMERYVVSCNGYITDFNSIMAIYYNCSPFISLFVREYNGQNIYAFGHEDVLFKNPLLNNTSYWMQILHGTNLANQFWTKSRFLEEELRTMNIGGNLALDVVGIPRLFHFLSSVDRHLEG